MTLPQYTSGYSIGVGGVVCQNQKVLFVRGINESGGNGHWQLPGGFVEKNELAEAAIVREVYEEAGIRCSIIGVVGIRHLLRFESDSDLVSENDLYIVFKLEPESIADVPKPDGIETNVAQFFSNEEIALLNPCPQIFKVLAKNALENQATILAPREMAEKNRNQYQIYF